MDTPIIARTENPLCPQAIKFVCGHFFSKIFSALFSTASKYMLDFDMTQIGIVAEMLQRCLLVKWVKLATVFPSLHCIRPAQPGAHGAPLPRRAAGHTINCAPSPRGPVRRPSYAGANSHRRGLSNRRAGPATFLGSSQVTNRSRGLRVSATDSHTAVTPQRGIPGSSVPGAPGLFAFADGDQLKRIVGGFREVAREATAKPTRMGRRR